MSPHRCAATSLPACATRASRCCRCSSFPRTRRAAARCRPTLLAAWAAGSTPWPRPRRRRSSSARCTAPRRRSRSGSSGSPRSWTTRPPSPKRCAPWCGAARPRPRSKAGTTGTRASATGALETRWRQATSEGGALFRLRNSLWVKRRVAREARDAALQRDRGGRHRSRRGDRSRSPRRNAADGMVDRPRDGGEGPGTVARLAARSARRARDARAHGGRCDAGLAGPLRRDRDGAAAARRAAVEVVGETGLRATLASRRARHRSRRRRRSTLLVGGDSSRGARDALAPNSRPRAATRSTARRSRCSRPPTLPSLMPDASAKVRLRRAELRGLL